MKTEDVTIIENDWGIYVKLKDGIAADDNNILTRLKYIIECCKEKKKSKIIINAVNTPRKISIGKMYMGAELVAQFKIANLKIAFVAPKFVNDSDSSFMHTTSYNRGFSLKYFASEEEAKNWLVD
jgi:hypothetical protein